MQLQKRAITAGSFSKYNPLISTHFFEQNNKNQTETKAQPTHTQADHQHHGGQHK
jgi:hypothetical protein